LNLKLSRRGLLRVGAIGAGTAALAACDPFGNNRSVRDFLQNAEDLTRAAHRALIDPNALAPEYTEAEIIQPMRANGSRNVQDAA
jgi:hypothetical protein